MWYDNKCIYKSLGNRLVCHVRNCLVHAVGLICPLRRPGPCGGSSLCNACGVQYMRRGERPRMIDMVMDDERVIWMERNPETFQWFESSEADLSDRRVSEWLKHEQERVQFADSKKRKFADL